MQSQIVLFGSSILALDKMHLFLISNMKDEAHQRDKDDRNVQLPTNLGSPPIVLLTEVTAN
jgi:hypothetical protein